MHSPQYVYRIATHSDKERVESIDRDVYSGIDYLPGIYDGVIDDNNCIAMVAEDANTNDIIGYVHGLVASACNRAISIQGFRIKPCVRKAGIGGQLRKNLLLGAIKIWPTLSEAHVCHYNKYFEPPHYSPHPLAQLKSKMSMFTIGFPISKLDSIRSEVMSCKDTTNTTKTCEDFNEFKQYMIIRKLDHVLSDFQLYETCEEFFHYITKRRLSCVLKLLDDKQQTVGIALVQFKLGTGICARFCVDLYVNNMDELNDINIGVFKTLIKMIPINLHTESPHPDFLILFSHEPLPENKTFATHLCNHFSVNHVPNLHEDHVLIRGYSQPIETFIENF